MSDAGSPVAQWNWMAFGAVVIVAVSLAWWLFRQTPFAAVLAAAGLVTLASSPPIRVLATQSHLIAMAALELILVVAPLLVLTAMPRPVGNSGRPSPVATAATITMSLLYAGLVVVIHVPVVHRRSAELGSVPMWMPALGCTIGLAYWCAVLRTAGRVPTRIRRATLLGAQEVAAFIGLLSLLGAWGSMAHMKPTDPLGISIAWDQRLGGGLMMATCAIVAIPLSRHLSRKSAGKMVRNQ